MEKTSLAGLAVVFAIVLSCDMNDLIDTLIMQNYKDSVELLQGDQMHMVLVGTGGPMENERRVSQCTAVIVGGEFFLVDTGPGSARQASLLKLPWAGLSGILQTHYHFDHIGDLKETHIQSWINGRTESLKEG